MKTKKTRLLLTGLALLGSVASSSAATIYADAKDVSVRYNNKNTNDTADDSFNAIDLAAYDDTADQIGRSGTGGAVRRALIFAFELPNLGATLDPFTAATFSFQNLVPLNINASEDVDLYGITARSAPDALNSDYFMGTNSYVGGAGAGGNPSGTNPADVDDTAADRFKLQDNILVAGTTPTAAGMITTDLTGSTNLLAYLNAQYNGGAGAGQYAILRLSMDTVPNGGDRFSVTMRDGANAANGGLGDLTIAPQINFTAVPEPSAALLGGFGLLALLRRRR